MKGLWQDHLLYLRIINFICGTVMKKVGSYKIGYAESSNGVNWKRLDSKININFKSNYEEQMREYPSLISIKNKLYMFYNGDQYGKDGILLAELKIKLT